MERHAGGRPVRAIAVRVGELRQVVPESLAFYVGIVGRGTVCEEARIDLELVAARVACCGEEWTPPAFRCPACGGAADVVTGNELEVESIVIEEVDEECIAYT